MFTPGQPDWQDAPFSSLNVSDFYSYGAGSEKGRADCYPQFCSSEYAKCQYLSQVIHFYDEYIVCETPPPHIGPPYFSCTVTVSPNHGQ